MVVTWNRTLFLARKPRNPDCYDCPLGIEVQFHKSAADTLNAVAPNGRHPHAMAPRGWYVLFILNADGVPPVAKLFTFTEVWRTVSGLTNCCTRPKTAVEFFLSLTLPPPFSAGELRR